MISACDVRDGWILGSTYFFPSAVDYWAEENRFLVGSYHNGAVQLIGRYRDHTFDLFQPPNSDGRKRTLRLKIDSLRNRLWLLDTDGVYLYALKENRLLGRVALPESIVTRKDCLPDLALDSFGAAYVSDNRRPVIYVIREQVHDAPLHKTDAPMTFSGAPPNDGGFSALAFVGEPPVLVAGSASTGRLWRVDVARNIATEIATDSNEYRGICGMAALPSRHSYAFGALSLVYATTGFRERLLGIALTPEFERASAVELKLPASVETPLSLVAFGSFLMLTSSQLGRHRDLGGQGAPVVPFRVVLMPMQLDPPTIRRFMRNQDTTSQYGVR